MISLLRPRKYHAIRPLAKQMDDLFNVLYDFHGMFVLGVVKLSFINKFLSDQFKADRLEMIVVVKNISVLQLFISRMPKMSAMAQQPLEQSQLYVLLN